jgi:WD40 repeat protein
MALSSVALAERAGIRRLLCVGAAVVLCPVAAIGAIEPAEALSLRIETGTHIAPIRAISADRAGRFAITAAEDKTARVWDVATGRLVQVFRPPSASGNDGKLFAAAMLPDGTLFAVAGWSAKNDLYLVNRSTAEITHRITGLPNVITAIAFSPDGRLLAIGLWGTHGVRLFASNDGWHSTREVAGDADIGGEIRGLAWSQDGRQLAATSADGVLRMYEAMEKGLRLVKRQPAQGREMPYGVAFSPDGKHLAVGAANLPVITVVDAGDLRREYAITAVSSSPESLSAVAWAPDGQRIYGAGTRRNSLGMFTLCIAQRQKSTCTSESSIAKNTVTGLVALGDGRVLYSTAEPSWGSVDSAGQRLVTVAPELSDFRGMRRGFALARDGAAVTVRSTSNPENAFDLRSLALVKAKGDWSLPAANAGRTSVGGWFEGSSPTINGRSVRLDDNELSLTAAVSPQGDRVTIGTSFAVRCYDDSGRELWRTSAPGTSWQVNLSADGRWAVAAFSDGTVRWYKMKDGSEQIALLLQPDGRHWVAWTPGGYFAVSPGGEDLLGWQVDRGLERAADFFPASRFRDQFYRPELIAAVLALGDERAALAADKKIGEQPARAKKVAEQLPPVVRIVSPDDGYHDKASQIRIVVNVQAPADAPLLRLRVRVNGAMVTVPEIAALHGLASNGVKSRGDTLELPLPLPESDADVMVFAENRHGVSPAAVLHVKRGAGDSAKRPGAPEAREPVAAAPVNQEALENNLLPALYMLSVGVSKYADKTIQLAYSAKDATDLSNQFRTQDGRLYRKVVVRLLTDERARRDDVLDGLEWIRREVTARDVAVVFLAGHGINDADGVYYYLPYDTDVKRLKRTGVIFTEIRNTLVSLPGKALFFVDTCHAGNVLGTGLRGLPPDTTAVVNELASAENGVVVFTASTGRQSAQESPAWGNGAFTKALIEGLSGKADMAKSGRITHKMLDLYVSERVKALTDGSQSPVTIVPRGVPDFPLAVAQAVPGKRRR